MTFFFSKINNFVIRLYMFQYKKFYLLMNLSKHKINIKKIYFSDNVEILKLICLKNEYNSNFKITPMLIKD